MPRLVGPSVAKELIFTGRIVDGLEAYSMGLVNAAVEQNEAGDAAYDKAVELAEHIIPNVRELLRIKQRSFILSRMTLVLLLYVGYLG